MIYKIGTASIIAVICFGISLRAIVSLYNFSGYKKPPMYGDYEAQRHWQEITVNIPMQEWYTNSTSNDLLYWGLDYPPLTAYHSYILGKIAAYVNESYIKLNESHGIYSEKHKYFMRNSVIFSDFLVYFTGIGFLIYSFGKTKNTKLNTNIILFCLIFYIYPGQILIDNGHFQYNNMSLGLTLWAISLILLDWHVASAIFFTLALNYKQMELYHALPFFVYLLRICFPSPTKRPLYRNFVDLLKIASAVISVFLILWLPWIFSIQNISSVISRIFPIGRGVFEDKVSNFWCIFNVFIKFKKVITNQSMALVCLCTTILSLLPSSIKLFCKPQKNQFLYALLLSSLGFFLFSFQVHEKSILMPALSSLVIFNKEPILCFWFLQLSTFSMFPLLHKDGLSICFIGLNLLFEAVFQIFSVDLKSKTKDKIINKARTVSLSMNIIIIMLFIYGPLPTHLPHLYSLLLSAYCCVHFLCFFVYFNREILYLK